MAKYYWENKKRAKASVKQGLSDYMTEVMQGHSPAAKPVEGIVFFIHSDGSLTGHMFDVDKTNRGSIHVPRSKEGDGDMWNPSGLVDAVEHLRGLQRSIDYHKAEFLDRKRNPDAESQ